MKNVSTRKWLLAMLFLFAPVSLLLAQTKVKVRGQVSDANGPLVGASVIEFGTTNGVTTDVEGRYTLTVPEGATLLFSYIGYVSQELTATEGVHDITLKEESTRLDDVVVVGYGVQKKSSVTGAISQVKPEDLQNRSITNAQSALQGKTAGVQIIQTSSAPGASPTVRVRGFSSNTSSNPLYVVDGIRLTSISGIDPNDIASMEVLKDAASAAIYGAEAGNGVVLITTKKGSRGKGKLTYDFQYSLQSLARIPKMLNSEQYIEYMTEGSILSRDFMLSNWDGRTNTSWTDVAFETSTMQKHNIAFTNGNERGSYYLSLSYLDNDGIVKGNADTYERLTATINGEYEIKPWLKVGSTNQIEKYDVRSVAEGNEYGSLLASVLLMDPLTPSVYAPDRLPAHMQAALNNNQPLLKDADGNYYSVSPFFVGEFGQPLIMRDNNVGKNGGFNVTGSIYGDFKPLKGLVITSRLGYRLSGTHSSTVSLPSYNNSERINPYLGYSAGSSTSIYYQWENFANYARTFGRHSINAMVGMSFQKTTSNNVYGQLTGNGEDALKKNDPVFWYLNYANASATKNVSGEELESAKLSYFGRVGYEFAGRYMIQASLRADAADLAQLPASNRWGYFPAVSAGWAISEEPFFESARKYVSSLKLRASWGQNGSLAALSNYLYSTDMALGRLYPFLPGNNYVQGSAPSSMGNDELRWETSEQFDIGLDARLFNDRLTFSIDWYDKKTKDLLVSGTTPSLIVGGTVSPINAGNVSNRGWEIELGWRDRIGDFSYSVRGNIATLKNKVTYLDPSLVRLPGETFHNTPITYFEKGYPIYYFRGYRFAGVDPATGDPTFEDLDGSGDVSDGDLTEIGSAIPDFTYGITLAASWKGLDLTLFGTGAHGNDIFNCINKFDRQASNKLKEVFYDNRWTPQNTSGTVPRAGAQNMDKYQFSDAMVYDGSFFKIKQIQLGYSFPKKWLRKAFIQNLRLYVSLDDFVTFTKYPGFDPEAATNDTRGMGIDKGSYPGSKKVVFGLNLEF